MRRNLSGSCLGVLAAVGALLASPPSFAQAPSNGDTKPAVASPTEAPPATAIPGPVNIFVNGPADVNSVWKWFSTPDFVLLRGDEYRRLAAGGAALKPANTAVTDVVAIRVEGQINGDEANLSVSIDTVLDSDARSWVPLRLDGLTLTEATEDGKPLPLRSVETGGWEVSLRGRGRHSVRVSLPMPVRTEPDSRRIEFTIPEAPSTRLEVTVPQGVSDALTGPGEPVAIERFSPEGAKSFSSRLTAELTPRSRLSLTWRPEAPAEARLAPLLVARGEIAVDIDPGSFRTKAAWSIRSMRGQTRELVIRHVREDEVLELELDGQAAQATVERAGLTTKIVIPLSEPLIPGLERRLVMTTRRSLPAGGSARVAFGGFSIDAAREQTGAIGVVSTDNLWVTGTPGRGVRQIDPRTELPLDLRSRPATEQAFRFTEQPFELAFRVEPSPPLVRVETRTTISIDPRSGTIDSRFDFETTRGKLYDLSLGLPPGLTIESVGPADVVGGWQVGVLPSPLTSALPFGALRLLSLRLGPKAQEGTKFTVRVVGRQKIDATRRDVRLALIQPIGVLNAGGRVAVLTEPGLTADLAERHGVVASDASFREAPSTPPADWPWPSGRAPAAPPMLWLRFEGTPPELPLRIATHPMSLSESTALTVRVDRNQADVLQETECSVQFGSMAHLDLEVPEDLAGRWQVEGGWRRTELGKGENGERVVKLDVPAEPGRPARLRLRYRLPVARGIELSSPGRVSIPWIRVAGATPTQPVRAAIETSPGLSLEAPDPSWRSDRDDSGSVRTGPLSLTGPVTGNAPVTLRLMVSERVLAKLPGVVASRLHLRSILGLDQELRTSALYRLEAHDGALAFTLPTGAVIVASQVGGVSAAVEQLSGERGYRIPLSTAARSGPLLVQLDYTTPRDTLRDGWPGPTLTQGGIVQDTLWEVQLPWNQAVVGVPAGWTDQNEWYWDVYVWKRRPRLGPAALAGWSGAPVPTRGTADLDLRSDRQAYLFGRPGGPERMSITVASRAFLVALCSGLALGAGAILILVWRPSVRLATAVLGLVAILLAAFVHPSVSLLALQSAEIGIVLTALIGMMHHWVEGRRTGVMRMGDAVLRSPGVSSGSGLDRVITAGSDDSTAIRVRTASTMDYAPLAGNGGLADQSGGSSRSETAQRGGAAP